MNSPKLLNYETRPFKFTERKMLLGTLLRLCHKYQGAYQYIGFGGLTFTDFKLFHKELHINEMYDIEGGLPLKKVLFNSPYSFIKVIPEMSTSALTQVDLSKKTIVWLDYDGAIDNYMFEDLSILMSKIPSGSIYIFTCNRELKDDETRDIYTVEKFREKFGQLAAFDLSPTDLSGSKDYLTIKTMLTNVINKTIGDRNDNGESLGFQQLYNILYQENRGAKMFTFGGVITEKADKIEHLNLDGFDFIRTDDTHYKIDIPNLTLKEIDLINGHMSNAGDLAKLKAMEIVTESEVNKYKANYKYLPAFFDVRL
jgi:hypothetical protein